MSKPKKSFMGARAFNKYKATNMSITAMKAAEGKAKKQLALHVLNGDMVHKSKQEDQ